MKRIWISIIKKFKKNILRLINQQYIHKLFYKKKYRYFNVNQIVKTLLVLMLSLLC